MNQWALQCTLAERIKKLTLSLAVNWSLRAFELPQPDVWLHFNHVTPPPCGAACARHPLKATAVTAPGSTFPQTCTRRRGKLRRARGGGGALSTWLPLFGVPPWPPLSNVSAHHMCPTCRGLSFLSVTLRHNAQSFDLRPRAPQPGSVFYEAYWINDVHLDCYHDDDLTGGDSARGRRPFVSSKHEADVQLCCKQSQVLPVRLSNLGWQRHQRLAVGLTLPVRTWLEHMIGREQLTNIVWILFTGSCFKNGKKIIIYVFFRESNRANGNMKYSYSSFRCLGQFRVWWLEVFLVSSVRQEMIKDDGQTTNNMQSVQVSNIWRFCEETATSSKYILDCSTRSFDLPLPSLPVNCSDLRPPPSLQDFWGTWAFIQNTIGNIGWAAFNKTFVYILEFVYKNYSQAWKKQITFIVLCTLLWMYLWPWY